MLRRFRELLRPLLRRPHTARGLADLALALWVVSLCLPGLVSHGQPTVMFGLNILLVGWLLPSAWYANPFLLFALRTLRTSDKEPLVSTALAVLIACTVFLVDEVWFDEGSARPLYGFGLGVAFWLAAIAVAVMAVGRRIAENHAVRIQRYEVSGSVRLDGNWWRGLGVLMLATIAFGAPAWAAWNFFWADSVEYKYLVYGPFKRGAVWHVGMPAPTQRMHLSGPLEVRYDRYALGSLSDTLLTWGVPAVRMNGLDYRLHYPAGQRVLSAVPAKGEAGARLVLDDIPLPGHSLLLTSADRSRVLAEHHWQVDRHWALAARWPTGYAPLRELVTGALNIDPSPAELASLARERLSLPMQQPVSVNLNPQAVAANTCPAGIRTWHGVRHDGYGVFGKRPEWKWVGAPVQVGDRVYFGVVDSGYNWVFCTGNVVYVLGDSTLEKHSLDDFRMFWAIRFRAWGVAGKSTPLAVRETREALFIDYRDYKDGQDYTAQLQVPETLPGTDYPIADRPKAGAQDIGAAPWQATPSGR